MKTKYTVGTLLWDDGDKEFGLIIGILNKGIYVYYESYWTNSGYLQIRISDLDNWSKNDQRFISYTKPYQAK